MTRSALEPIPSSNGFASGRAAQTQRFDVDGAFVMNSDSTTAEQRLAQLGIVLPPAPKPFGAYVPAVRTGDLLFLSGMLASSGHSVTAAGVVGRELDIEAGRKAARLAALNVLAVAEQALGSLNGVSHVVRLGVY
ncbi:MAG TPA: RidA family protein, partial [Polyangiales bacterium]